MTPQNNSNFLTNLKYDIPASIVVFLVAVPLCLGIALASGAPLFSGIIAGMAGGIIVTVFSGSQLGVSGPAAGLAVIVLNAIGDLGAFDIFLLAVVIAGVFQMIMGLLKAGVIAYYFPSSVIKGMLSGIGIIIILKQIPHAFGYDANPEGEIAFKQPDGENTFSELINMLDFISPGAIAIVLVSLAILILFEQSFIKQNKVLKLIPGALVAVTTGVLMNIGFANSATFGLNPDQLVQIPVSDSIIAFFGQFTFPDFSQWNNPDVYVVAITLAVVASLETLLCVEATDKLDPQKRVTPTNRELLAQGAGNLFSGMVGGIPVTQVIVRSSANIQAGGRTKAAAFIHGLLLLVCAMMIPFILNMIPLASLAAILFMVGYKLAKPSLFIEMYRKGKSQYVPYFVTILGIVFTDLLMGIALGMVVGIIQILWNNYQVAYHLDEQDFEDGKIPKIQLAENVSFLNKASILRMLEELPEESHLIIDASKTKNIHQDVIEVIQDYKVNAKMKNIIIDFIQKSDRKFIHGDHPFTTTTIGQFESIKNHPDPSFLETSKKGF